MAGIAQSERLGDRVATLDRVVGRDEHQWSEPSTEGVGDPRIVPSAHQYCTCEQSDTDPTGEEQAHRPREIRNTAARGDCMVRIGAINERHPMKCRPAETSSQQSDTALDEPSRPAARSPLLPMRDFVSPTWWTSPSTAVR